MAEQHAGKLPFQPCVLRHVLWSQDGWGVLVRGYSTDLQISTQSENFLELGPGCSCNQFCPSLWHMGLFPTWHPPDCWIG